MSNLHQVCSKLAPDINDPILPTITETSKKTNPIFINTLSRSKIVSPKILPKLSTPMRKQNCDSPNMNARGANNFKTSVVLKKTGLLERNKMIENDWRNREIAATLENNISQKLVRIIGTPIIILEILYIKLFISLWSKPSLQVFGTLLDMTKKWLSGFIFILF